MARARRRTSAAWRSEVRVAFNPRVRSHLTKLLGSNGSDSILVEFEAAASTFRERRHLLVTHRTSEEAIDELARAAKQFRAALGGLDGRSRALLLEHLLIDQGLASEFLRRMEKDLASLIQSCARASQDLRAHRKPGRPIDQVREQLIIDVVEIFRRHGLRAVTSPDGLLARCLEVILPTVGLSLPVDRFRLLGRALKS